MLDAGRALLAYPCAKLAASSAIATVGFGEIVRVVVNNLSITGVPGLSGIPNDVTTRSSTEHWACRGCAVLLSRTKFALASP